MKQITYDLEPQQVLGILLDNLKPEDGNYEMTLTTESLTATFPQLLSQQREGSFQGVLNRVIGFKLTKVASQSPISIGVKDGSVVSQPIQGELFDGIDRDNNRSQQSSKAVGENS